MPVIPADTDGDELQPESYSSGEPEADELKPETYGAVAGFNLRKSLKIRTADTDSRIHSIYWIVTAQSENRKAIGTFLSKDWQPVSDNPRYGLLPLFFGTLKVTLIAILFAAPIAILAAIYTAMFAPARIREYHQTRH